MDKIHYISPKLHILQSPHMYLGTGQQWDSEGLHTLIAGVADRIIDPETLNNPLNLTVHVTLDTIIFSDDGIGLPVQNLPKFGTPGFVQVLTGFASTKINAEYYNKYGFLDRLGCVLSVSAKELTIQTVKNEKLYRITTSGGEIIRPLELVGDSLLKGTQIMYTPNEKVFSNINFSSVRIVEDLSKLAHRYHTTNVTYQDYRVDGEDIVIFTI